MEFEAEFNLLLRSFDQDPSTFSKVLRSYSASNREAFVAHARKALVTAPPCRALKCLTGLLTLDGVLQFLLERYARSRHEALSLAKKIMQFEPRFDAALIEFIEDKDLVEHSEQTVLNALDILDEISERDRLVLNILTFLKHPNPRLRSKAARLLGRRRPDAACMDALMQESDPRVRANAVESLFGVRNEHSRKLFRVLANDAHNRVAGNARLGLYLLGETDSICLIDEMASDSRAHFRNTGAWIIGKISDPRFSPTLAQLMTDPDELVRAQSFRALRNLKCALKATSDKDSLNLVPLYSALERDVTRLSIAVFDSRGLPVKEVPGTKFLIRTDGDYVRSYSVREQDGPNSMNIAFVLALPKEAEEEIARQLENAVGDCLSVRRPSDRWSVSKLTRNGHWARFGQPTDHAGMGRTGGPSYAGQDEEITAMLRNRPAYLNGSGEDEALQKCLQDLLVIPAGSSYPDLIFCGEAPHDVLIGALLNRSGSGRFRVHGALVGDSVPGRFAELVESTNGVLLCSSQDDVAGNIRRVYASLLHRYELSWSQNGAEMNICIDWESRRGAISEYRIHG